MRKNEKVGLREGHSGRMMTTKLPLPQETKVHKTKCIVQKNKRIKLEITMR